MLGVKAVNAGGQQLDFSGNSNYAVTSVAGVMPPKANVNTAALATKDGSVFNSSRLTNRNVVLSIFPLGNVEANRVALYTYFKAKKAVRLYFTTASRSVYIDGWVESVTGDLFAIKEKVQVSVICPDPWFKAVASVTANFDATTHSVTVSNNSDDEVGFVAEFTASGSVSNIVLLNSTTGKSFGLNFGLQSGDKVILNTQRGEKSVKLVRGGAETNLLNYMDITSDWVQLVAGSNTLTVSATSGISDLAAKLTFQPIYEGV